MPVLGESDFESAVQKVMNKSDVSRKSAEKIVGAAESKKSGSMHNIKLNLLRLQTAAFKEEEHPRDEGGEFTSGEGGGTKKEELTNNQEGNKKQPSINKDNFISNNETKFETVLNDDVKMSAFLIDYKKSYENTLLDIKKGESREKFEKEAQGQISKFYKTRLKNAKSFYRGTSTEELDSLLKVHQMMGNDFFDYSPVSVNKDIARKFAVTHGKEGVIIEFSKKRFDVVSQGYDISDSGDSDKIEEPQGLTYLEEEEHRIPSFTDLSKAKLTIHVKALDGDQVRKFNNKYESLGRIVFD